MNAISADRDFLMQITITRSTGKLGPFSLEQVNAHLASGHLFPNDLAWWAGQNDWVPLHQVPGVKVPVGQGPSGAATAPLSPAVARPPVAKKGLSSGSLVLGAVGGVGCLGFLFIAMLVSIGGSMKATPTTTPALRAASAPSTSSASTQATAAARAADARAKAAESRAKVAEAKAAQAEQRAKNAEARASKNTVGNEAGGNTAQPTEDEASRNVQVVDIKGVGKREAGVVDDVVYVIGTSEKSTAFGNQYSQTQADGIFLVLHVAAHNNAKETHDLNTSLMKLQDAQGREFDPSNKGTTALALSGDKSVDIGLTQIQPGTNKKFSLVYDIPDDASGLKLKIPGGFMSTSGDAIIKVP